MQHQRLKFIKPDWEDSDAGAVEVSREVSGVLRLKPTFLCLPWSWVWPYE